MGTPELEKKQPPQTAKALSARLCAVQALYQMSQNEAATVKDVLQQYLDDAKDLEIDGEKLVQPDGALFKKILSGAHERLTDLEGIILANYQPGKEGEKTAIEPLLKAILLAASYEILAHQDIDSPIIINDYLNVTHSFYSQGEVGLVNGMLDAISGHLRS